MTLHVKWEMEDSPMGDHVRYSVDMAQDMNGQHAHASALIPTANLYEGKMEVWKAVLRVAIREGIA